MTALFRIAAFAILPLLLCTGIAFAQPDDDDGTFDEELPEDAQEWEYDSAEFAPDNGSFGIFLGSSTSLTTLAPEDLDPAMDASLIHYSGTGLVILNHWVLGGVWAYYEAHDLSGNYDQFDLSYGGILLGYDAVFAEKASLRGTLTAGSGALKMIRHTDITDDSGHEFLERYRQEDFFVLRPELSLGYQIFSFIDVRLMATYHYPIGTEQASTLRDLTYGIQILLGTRSGSFY